MTGIQQSSIFSFVPPLGPWEHFAEEAPVSNDNKSDGKRKDRDKEDRKADCKRQETKKPRFDTGWLIYEGEGAPKLSALTCGRLHKDYATVGPYCNRKDCNYDGHISRSTLNNKDKDIMDDWIRNSRTIICKEG